MNKQFVPWNVGFAIKNFIKNSDPDQSSTFEPSIDLVYDTVIDSENIPKYKWQWHSKKNTCSDIFGYLRHVWYYNFSIIGID
jgi:hypothetical protein